MGAPAANMAAEAAAAADLDAPEAAAVAVTAGLRPGDELGRNVDVDNGKDEETNGAEEEEDAARLPLAREGGGARWTVSSLMLNSGGVGGCGTGDGDEK